MQKKSLAFWERTAVKPYWFLIIGLLLVLAVVFGYHLVTERTPSAAAVSIGGFSIYWYCIFIVGGIALGAYVVSDLATDRALALFTKAVPARIQETAVAALKFPAAIQESLDKLRIATIGHFLLQWGYNPRNLGFKDEETAVVEHLNDINAQKGKQYLEQMAAKINARTQTYCLPAAHTADTLLKFVDSTDIDLVILSAHGHSSQTKRPYGSVASNFIAYGSTALLLIQDLSPEQIQQTRTELSGAQNNISQNRMNRTNAYALPYNWSSR